MRKTCIKRHHKFDVAYIGAPYSFCRRWFCNASAVSVFAPAEIAVKLHNAIPREHRFPPVELNSDGSIKEEF